MSPAIQLATITDLNKIDASYEELLDYESQHGSNTSWIRGIYPTREIARAKIDAETMFILNDTEAISQGNPDGFCASFAMDSSQPPEYADINWQWQAPPEKILTLHTLVVRPSCAGKGYGSDILEFAKTRGRQRNLSVMRIDTWIQNLPARNLYLKNGFTVAGYHPIQFYGLVRDAVYLEFKL